MANADSEDDLKRQMRRRLVGAVALFTALVIILPMLLEDSPNPQTGKLELRIPDMERAGAFTTQMVVPESAPDMSGAPASEVAPAAPSPAPAAPVKAAPGPEAAAKETPRTAAGKPAPRHETVRHEAARQAAGKPAAEPKAAAKSGFAVQVGAFSHADTANELQAKLALQGWHAYTRKAGQHIRVRVGAYAAREEAERAQRKLQAQGQGGAVVVTEP